MRSTPDLPTDPLGNLGKAIRPEPEKPADKVDTFNSGNWAPKGLVISDKPDPIVSDGQMEDWEGLCASPTFTGTHTQPAVFTYSMHTEEELKALADVAEFLKNLPEYGGLL
jgi:hypothetical protein